jgi:excisionase family DNA binding protein
MPADTIPLRPSPAAPAVLAVTVDVDALAAAVAAQVVAQLRQAQAADARPAGAEPAEPALLTRAEAARRLGCSVGTVDNMARDGRLRVTRIGRAVRIPLSELRRLSAAPAPPPGGG